MSAPGDYRSLPDELPEPMDDGAADHLSGALLPELLLPSSCGPDVDLRELARSRIVVYVYPRTGIPGEPLPEGWDLIPGARGCTPQSCAFRDHAAEIAALGASIVGVSAQPAVEQREFAEREHLPYPLLNDSGLRLAATLALPTFEASGMRLYRRLTFVASQGRVEKVFYPVFPPDRNAADVIAWLAAKQERL